MNEPGEKEEGLSRPQAVWHTFRHSRKQQLSVVLWGAILGFMLLVMALPHVELLYISLERTNFWYLLGNYLYRTSFLAWCCIPLFLILLLYLLPRSIYRYVIPIVILTPLLIMLFVEVVGWFMAQSNIDQIPIPNLAPTGTVQIEETEVPLGVEIEMVEGTLGEPPPLLERLFTAILLLTGGIALLLGVWLWWRGRTTVDPLLPELAQEMEEALASLQQGASWADVVLRCYAEMERALFEMQGVSRPAYNTPQEFITLVVRRGFPEQPVTTLTRLFEQVRYGHVTLDEGQQAEAVASLDAIIAFCRQSPQLLDEVAALAPIARSRA